VPRSEAIRVALIRGAALNPFDAQQYGAGERGVEMFGISNRRLSYPLDLLEMPVRHVPAVADYIPRRAANALERFQSPTWSPSALLGLGWAVRGCAILHVAETFIVTSGQAARLRQRSSRHRLVVTVWENLPFAHEDDAAVSERKRLVRRMADGFVAVSTQARDALRAEGVADSLIEIRPPAVDESRFSPVRQRPDAFAVYGVPDGCRTVLYVGRLIREKGVVDLVMALAGLPADVHLVCVGEGDERPRLIAAARVLGVGERVHFAGAASYDEIPCLMASCDTLAVPSWPTPYWTEQFGMVLAEGMSCGAPIVAYDSGAISEVVGDAAVLCPPGDWRCLTARLHALLGGAGRAQELTERGLGRAAALYAATQARHWWADYYREVQRR
jgi:glycosyltransferase involved in cell wall biosynthesis